MSDSKPRPVRGPFAPTIILHGGAGSITRSNLPPSLYRQYHQSLLTYLVSAHSLLNDSVSPATALDAAIHAVSLMEDDPLFNCGKGSVFNLDGEIEMEASIAITSVANPDHSRVHQRYWQHKSGSAKNHTSSPGSVKRSAAVSLIRNTRHPIHLAREVLLMADEDRGLGGTAEMHGHLSGGEIEEWGWKKKGLERKPDQWFWTKRRWEEHRRGLGKDANPVDKICGSDLQEKKMTVDEQDEVHGIEGPALGTAPANTSILENLPENDLLELPSQGTVGCVCIDSWGTLAVATSTGGLTNKRPGRIGDTPTVGAGFWAESWYEAVSEPSTLQVTTRTEDVLQTSISQIQNGINRFLQQSWIAQCLIPTEPLCSSRDSDQEELLKMDIPPESKSPLYQTNGYTKQTQRRAVAISGTGNGDSFLRTNAARTTAAMCRFAHLPLSDAVTAVSGPNGELQQSAGDRWNKTGEGQGGIIAIEAIESEGKHTSKVVFDFNCGGMWRAWYDNGKPRVMVFRDEY